MIDYISDNKDWIFSGIGGTVIIGFFYLLKILFKRYSSLPKTPPQKQTEKDYCVISYEDFFKGLLDESKTLLQKNEFKEKYMGRMVRWKGIVKSVSPIMKSGSASDEIAVFFKSDKDDKDKQMVCAEFTGSMRKDLVELSYGDSVEIEGLLSRFIESYPYGSSSPTIKNAKLVSYKKITNT